MKADDSPTLLQASGFVRLTDWHFVSLKGKDRTVLLHNFCTANIRQLETGRCTEAFILNEKGKTLWFGHVLALPDQLLLLGAGPFGERIRAHLDRYVIREDVQVTDLTGQLQAWFAFGEISPASFAGASVDRLPSQNECVEFCAGELQGCLANLELGGWGLVAIVERSLAEGVESILNSALPSCELEQFNALRIFHQVPWYGRDIDESNLPQEVNRNSKAISFTKGCYLGQETVARLDALGHVNQLLVGLKFEPDSIDPNQDESSTPSSGMVIEVEGKRVVRCTSVAKWGQQWRGLGYVRREFAMPGTVIPIDKGKVIVLTADP